MKKRLSKLSDKQKELLLKGSLIASSLSIVLTIIFDIARAFFEFRNWRLSEIFEICEATTFLLGFIFLGIFIYLTGKIEFLQKKEPSKKINIKAKSYLEFEESLKEILFSENYEKE